MSESSIAQTLFTDFLQRLRAGEEVEFERWVLGHGIHQPELRQLHRAWALREGAAPLSFFGTGEAQAPPPADGLEPGKVIADFRLVRLIGQGGMGQVWRAAQISLGGRPVAVKFVRPERVTERQQSYFEREARAGGRLDHPGIVSVHGFGRDAGVAWIAMELVDGCWNLRDFLNQALRAEVLPADYERRVARFVARTAQAMHAAHLAGVIHRDLKPQNILVTRDEHPKVTDFGLARITDESALSQTGEFAGTYAYMSPEQVAAKRMGIDHRTDIFSLGVVLYEMLTLRRPFLGENTHQLALEIVTREPPDMRELRPHIPRDLAVICGKALEKDPERRYASMEALADDLERALANEPIRARPPTRTERLVKWVRRHPAPSLAASVVVLALLAISILALRIARQKRDLESANTALSTRTAEAQASAAAERQRADEVLRLSLAQDHEDLRDEADRLWPAQPDRIGALRAWLARARALTGQLPTLLETRDELRALALPQSEEERRADREGHPDFAELGRLEGELACRARALAQRRDGESAALPAVDWSAYPADARGLAHSARTLVDPARHRLGGEALGLVLARRAMELAGADERAEIRSVLTSACLAVGLDEDALGLAYMSLDEAAPERRAAAEFGLATLEAFVARARSEADLERESIEVAALRAQVDALRERVGRRHTWTFPEATETGSKARWWLANLDRLIEDLQGLSAPGSGLATDDGIDPRSGWSVPRRLGLAERLAAGFAPGGEYARRWQAALPDLRAAYPGLDRPGRPLDVQMGLVPIGPDPASKLWEFWHVASGTEPLRDGEGRLVLQDASGLVFVLLPGGRFWMGAQAATPDGPNYDASAEANEGPVREIELSGFFLSKYEMTQGQWLRATGANPSRNGPEGQYFPSWNAAGSEPTWLEPVEQVSWSEALEVLARLGLSLPSEAQWEYGARAGTRSPWCSGAARESLRGAANLADAYAASHGAEHWTGIETWLDDGHTIHAPVAALRANAFGLHNVHGNVWEWCLDDWDESFYRIADSLDPLNRQAGDGTRVFRGGSYDCAAIYARSANRHDSAPSYADDDLGLRPARALTD